MFQIINQKWSTPKIDSLNLRAWYLLHIYVAWSPDNQNNRWTKLEKRRFLYTSPPFSLIVNFVWRVKKEFNNYFNYSKLVIPISVCSNIRLLHSKVFKSSLLTQSKKLLLHPQGQVYPLALTRTLKLVHWKISRKILVLEENSKSPKKLISSFRRSGTKANYQLWSQFLQWIYYSCYPSQTIGEKLWMLHFKLS